ncbi:methylenetetrahydrofolate--tRNA-(uracil(54)-C(5))-methyltransferase (FADH(2)-oxidizing) TrmFO [Synergistaceae bacterium OttesenSCG-928-I11]|nr:methylenetetrahydrofolate--tRNA-(uracil(54)-C(5))-methyltransferase (FADH(2)-oxidizing) TrmFO [Synergistaceae bacterium OttesenSCG-928-I11]
MKRVAVIGAGLAGSEAAYQLAKRGVHVDLYEMRPEKKSPAHATGDFAELVCSNSLGADRATSPAGILKQELRALDSLVIRCATEARVPAGGALAVDRAHFSALVTKEIEDNPRIAVVRTEVRDFFDVPTIVAAGPLLAGALAERLKEAVGHDYLSFFDAAAPIVAIDSVDMAHAYRAGRYGQADDYVNCPMNREEYEAFVAALVAAERVPLHEVDFRGETEPENPNETRRERNKKFFEGCLPVEVMADRGIDTLRYGPMRPIGLPDPRTGREPYAVLQLRRDNAEGTLYNMVGFQTNLKWPEQERVFRMIPALRDAEFVRKGVMHRNTFVCAPLVLDYFLRPRREGGVFRPDLFLAGQITGVEGYVESTACGLVAALNAYALLCGEEMPVWPRETAIGSLLHYLQNAEPASFQPMNVNLGIFPPLEGPATGKRKKLSKPERSQAYADRSEAAMAYFMDRYRIV